MRFGKTGLTVPGMMRKRLYNGVMDDAVNGLNSGIKEEPSHVYGH